MSAGTAGPTGSSRAPYEGERSVGQLFAAATADLSSLVHDEIALAKAEIRADVKRGVAGSVSGVVAGVIALASIPMFSFAAAYLLRYWGCRWAARSRWSVSCTCWWQRSSAGWPGGRSRRSSAAAHHRGRAGDHAAC